MQTVTIPQALEIALQHHRAGRLAEAEGIYRQILAQEPSHAGALHYLGVIAHQVGRNDLAVDLIRKAIAINPSAADYHSNLGVALDNSGQSDEAIAACRRAIELKPDFAAAHNNLGNALRNKGSLDEAAASFRTAIQLKPDFAEAHNNLGTALGSRGKLDEAIAAYHSALALKPDYAEALFNLANALKEKGDLSEAVAAFRSTLVLRPDLAEVHNNLGTALQEQGRLDEAVAAYRKAITIEPELVKAHNNLGKALTDQGQLDEAIAACRRAIEIEPDYAEAHNNFGNALTDRGQLDEAIAAFRRAIEIKPDFAEAWNNLGVALSDKGRIDEAVVAYRTALQFKPDFTAAHNNLGTALKEQGRVAEAIAAYRKAIEMSPGHAGIHGNILLDLHFLPELDAQAIFQEHRRWAETHAEPLAKFITPFANDRTPDRRLRVGYVSPDFHEHSVAFFIEPLLAGHDRGQVEVFCYADVLRSDAVTARLRQHAGHWRNVVGISDSQVADLVHQDQIDILVDLAGHTAHNRLLVFARKPAPIQVTYLGYPDTTGMDAVDYRLTDENADPPGATEQFHSEQLVRLPAIFACFRPAEDSPLVGPLPASTKGHVTFAGFHKLPKLNEQLLEWWARILLQVPDSRLLMMAIGLDEISRQRQWIEFFARKGVAPERLEFKGRQSLPRYLALHHEVDLLLDSHPFTGHTISCHALWMGVPVVTLAGDRHCSRMVASVLKNLELPDLIARTPDEYVKIASELAGDLPRLAELRSTLRERMRTSPLTDAPCFARNVEQAYRKMWRSWCANPS